jgi:hypothetical protein
MSTYLKTANLDRSKITYKIVEDARLDHTAIVDVVQGSGTLRTIEVDATAAQSHQYLKLRFTSTEITVGTTVPEMVLFVASAKRFVTEIPGGITFTGLSAWLTSSQEDSATANAEAAAGRYTIVRFITS